MIARVYLVLIAILFLGAVSSAAPGADSSTTATVCIECQNKQAVASQWSILEEAQNVVKKVYEGTKGFLGRTKEVVSNWISNAWHSATKPRQVARFMGGGVKRGNRSKGMCAQAAKEALVNSNICHGKLAGNAIDLHRRGILRSHCPRLKLSSLKDPRKAPNGSVIVYSGYAGRRPHNYGHIEAKLVKNGVANYCSDFCAFKPTKKSTNRVAAIYVLE